MSNEAYILQETKQFVFSQISINDTAAKEHIMRVVALAQALCRAYPQANPFRIELLVWLVIPSKSPNRTL